MHYPQFRKYVHGRTYFKIISPTEFEEIHILGDKHIIHHFIAKILPDRNYIYDLTQNYQGHWEVITEKEYQEKTKVN